MALVPELAQPIRVTEELQPVSVTERKPGVHVIDLGQNLVGWVRLQVEGERGTTVRLRFAEMLEPDGSLHLANLRTARPQETCVLRGGGRETFEPRFTFHGFRYVEVTGLAQAPAHHRHRRPLRHAPRRAVRVLERPRQPALAQRRPGASAATS